MGLVVTIDGGAGTGTSSLARGLAKELNWECLNSGHLYRSIAWMSRRERVSSWDTEGIVNLARDITFTYKHGSVVALNSEPLEEGALDSMSGLVEHIAGIPDLREIIRAEQHRYVDATPACFIEGRDLGTVVFAEEATLKLFLTCDDKVRARRRSNQLGRHISVEELLERDRVDEEREASPMLPAPDAIPLNTPETDVPELIGAVRVLLMGRPQARRYILSQAA